MFQPLEVFLGEVVSADVLAVLVEEVPEVIGFFLRERAERGLGLAQKLGVLALRAGLGAGQVAVGLHLVRVYKFAISP